MYTLLFEIIFFECNIILEYFLFTNLTITHLLSVVLLWSSGKQWQPSISAGFIYNVGIFTNLDNIVFKIFIRYFVRKYLMILYCSALACNFSRLMIWFSRLMLTFLMITSLLVFFFICCCYLNKTSCKLFYLIYK